MNGTFYEFLISAKIARTTNICIFTLGFNKILKVSDFFSIVDKLFEAARNFTKEVDAFYTMQMNVRKSK